MVIPVVTVVATVNVVLAVTVEVEPEVGGTFAVIVVVPTATAVAKPEELTVAVEVDDEVHVAWLLRSLVVPSPSVPVAVNCCVFPGWMEGVVGVSATDTMLEPDTKK